MASAGIPSGATSGIAQGVIRIDVSDLSRARSVVQSESRAMTRELQRGLGAALESVAQQGALAAAGVTLGGVRSANQIKRLNSLMTTLAGSEEKAAREMAKLEALAERTHQPFLDILESATGLYPAVRTTNADLGKTITLAQRLAVLDPAQGVRGATFAIREFLSGEYISLSRRFELDRSRLKDIRDEAAGDQGRAIELLSDYVDQLGLTEDAMIRMNQEGHNAFSVMRTEVSHLLGEGLEPTASVLNDIAFAFADMAREARQANGDLVRVLGTLTGIVGLTSAPRVLSLIPGVGAVPGARALGRAGVGAAALYGGAQAGAFVARQAGVGEARGRGQDEVLDTAFTRIKQAIVAAFALAGDLAGIFQTVYFVIDNGKELLEAGFELAAATVGNAIAPLVGVFGEAAAGVARVIGEFLVAIDTIDLGSIDTVFGDIDLGELDLGTGGAGRDLINFADNVETLGDSLRTSDEEVQRLNDRIDRGIYLTNEQGIAIEATQRVWDELTLSLGEALGVIGETPTAFQQAASAFQNGVVTLFNNLGAGMGAGAGGFGADVLEAWTEFQDELAAITEQESADLLAEEERAAEARADVIRRFGQQVADMLEDENIRYARALQATQDREADIRASLLENIQEAEADHREKVQDLQDEARKADEKATEDHLKRLRDITRDGRESVISAAIRLDAIGVYEAQRAAARKREAEIERYQDERDDRQDALDEALDQELEHYDERLRAQQEDGRDRIRELWDQFRKEEALRAEDFNRRLSRMQRDHNQQLQELDRQNQQRLAQIRTQAAQERQMLEQEFIQTYNALQTDAGNHMAVLVDIHRKGQDQIEADLRAWYDRQRGIFQQPVTSAVGGAVGAVGSFISGIFQEGGTLPATGLFMGHRGEEVIPARESALLRNLMGGRVSAPALVAAVAGGGRNGKSVSIANMPIYMPQTDRPMTEYDIRRIVEQAIERKLGVT